MRGLGPTGVVRALNKFLNPGGGSSDELMRKVVRTYVHLLATLCVCSTVVPSYVIYVKRPHTFYRTVQTSTYVLSYGTNVHIRSVVRYKRPHTFYRTVQTSTYVLSYGTNVHIRSIVRYKRLHMFYRTVQTLRETGSFMPTWFWGYEVVSIIVIDIALPKLDWMVQRVVHSCSGCLFFRVTPGKSASNLNKMNNYKHITIVRY